MLQLSTSTIYIPGSVSLHTPKVVTKMLRAFIRVCTIPSLWSTSKPRLKFVQIAVII